MSSKCSTAHKVRRSRQGPARAPADITLTEQDRLGPRPAVRQGASRARNCAATGVFSFDGSTAVFFLPPQKENGGGLPRVTTRNQAPFGAAAPRHAVPRAWPPPTKFRTEIWGVGQVVGPCGCAAHRVIPRSAGWEQGVYRGSRLWYTGSPDFTRG